MPSRTASNSRIARSVSDSSQAPGTLRETNSRTSAESLSTKPVGSSNSREDGLEFMAAPASCLSNKG
jgi:hypothetical protein